MMRGAEEGVFVDVQRVRDLLQRRQAVVVDARSPRAFELGHLPGARHLAARDLNPVVEGIRQLAPAERLAASLLDQGIGAGTTVIYGARGGSDAAHLWWTLHAHGHRAAYLLDGGIEAWEREGLPLEEGRPDEGQPAEAPAEPFTPRLEPARRIALDELRQRLEDPSLLVLDTRDASEYSGELVAAARGGHLPGARHFDWRSALTDEGLLIPERALREALGPALDAAEVATYCQSGVRAAHTHAVLTHLGQPNARLYLASWGEWGNRDDTPVDAAVPEPEEVDS